MTECVFSSKLLHMAKTTKQNDDVTPAVPNEIFAAAPIEAAVKAPDNKPLELGIVVRPNGESNFDVLTIIAGKEEMIEKDVAFNVARSTVGRLSSKMLLAARREIPFTL